MNLNTLLQYLSSCSGLLINMHNVTGILSCPPFDIERTFRKHTLKFCDIAKTTEKGFGLCTSCKKTVCKMAIKRGKAFFGVCPYGLLELVYPINLNEKTECILFLENQTENISETAKKAEITCKMTGVDFEKLSKEFANIKNADKSFMLKTARIADEFIKLMYYKNRKNITYSGHHSKITEDLCLYADEYFDRALTLKKMSELYFMNEKYLGRLFLKQTGQTFHSYVNMRRLDAAENLLKTTDRTVLDILVECGFNSISYFNRIFRARYKKTPAQYRKLAQTKTFY